MHKRRVAISGHTLFCEEVASQIRRVDPSWEPVILQTKRHRDTLKALFQLASSSVWYSIGSPVTDRWVYWLARLLRKPRVIHWVGSDIATARNKPDIVPLVSSKSVRHLAEVDFTARELLALGLPSTIIPLPPRFRPDRVPPLPERFTVLLYIPKTRMDFYGRADYERLVRSFADRPVRWLIVGGGKIETPAGADVRNLGWIDDLSMVYPEVTVLLRHTVRDGLSLMVLESLSFGRYVVWSQPFPYTRTATAYDELERGVNDLLERHLSGQLSPQFEAAEFAGRNYATDSCIADIAAAWKEAL